jgi:hypothetical protein
MGVGECSEMWDERCAELAGPEDEDLGSWLQSHNSKEYCWCVALRLVSVLIFKAVIASMWPTKDRWA